MKRFLAVAFLTLIAAAPADVIPGLEENGYYIEPGVDIAEELVSEAVFEARADGGRLYLVILSEEPGGGATTFSDSVLDLLGGEGYVVTVAPETVGWASDQSSWSDEEMDEALDASLAGSTDDEVVQLFVRELTGGTIGGGTGGGGSSGGGDDSGGSGLPWLLLAGGAILVLWLFLSKRGGARRMSSQLEQVKGLARGKLNEVANDVLEMEDEVAVSGSQEVKDHYARASAIYTTAIETTEHATTVAEMLEVSRELDLAIWELDCAEALLDGKPKPPKPEPPRPEQTTVPTTPPGTTATQTPGLPPGAPPRPDYDRRPQRQSSGSSELMTMLMTMLAMGRMRQGGGWPGGGWTGGGLPGDWTGGGRSRGGGWRTGGGGRSRGGGRRG